MTTASAGMAVDQRTSQPITNAIPTAAQLDAQRKALKDGQKRDRDELAGYLEQALAPQVTSGDGTVNVRRLNTLIQTELDRLGSFPDGVADALASYRLAAKTPAPKGHDRERVAPQKAATEEAKALIAEIENRSAWLYRHVIADRAVERRVIEAVQRLTELQAQHRLPIDLGYHLRLAGDAVALAGQYVHWINSHQDENLWRQTLPELEALELPAELRASSAVAAADPATDQLNRKPFDPNEPKDRAMRLAAGSTSMSRNPDGTLSAGSVQSPFGGNSAGAAMPRTEAEDRAARKKVAAELEDGA